ncbi:hypothetical protein [Microbacterium trichothecenolyticum]|uniref:Uncharacterized protein n=1 Tax=Microbacterium trichothecenolyticum TaxID=69370 RepID=A0A0M2HG16_MICTR|nr:hypothetical protein [Microbacterium trichothecenolyticum]KJL45607.1 hypothetical protein RS82_00159 [Microbacterium trichothecenolyticum]
MTAHDPYLTRLDDATLEAVARDRAVLWQTAIDNGDYDTAQVLRDALFAVNREVERRVDLVITQGRAIRALIDNGDLPKSARVRRRWADTRHLFDTRTATTIATASPEEAAEWKDADDQFRL